MENEKLRTEVDVISFAKNLAQGNDWQQANLINKFAYELKICCKDNDLIGLQPCNISDKLDSNGIDLVKSLAEFIKLREDNKPN